MYRFERFRSLAGDERRFLVKAIFWLPVTSILVRLFGLKRTLGYFQLGLDPVGYPEPDEDNRLVARKAAHMINIAANHGFCRARCLQKSLVLVKFLRDLNIPSTLVVGARRQGEEFGAHAWVKCAGAVVNDHDDVERRYKAFGSPADNSE